MSFAESLDTCARVRVLFRLMTDATAVRRLLTVEEVAERLGVKKRKVYELMATGELASIKLPPGTLQAARRIEEAEYIAFIERNRVVPGST